MHAPWPRLITTLLFLGTLVGLVCCATHAVRSAWNTRSFPNALKWTPLLALLGCFAHLTQNLHSRVAAGLDAFTTFTEVHALVLLFTLFAAIGIVTSRSVRAVRATGLPRDGLGPQIAVLASAFIVSMLLVPSLRIQVDPLFPLRLAQDCRFSAQCWGPPGSVGLLAHGTAWPRFLAALLDLDISVAAFRPIVLGLHALAATLIFRITERITASRIAGLIVAVLWCQTILLAEPQHFWNPTLMPLAGALFATSAYRALETHSRSDLLMAGLALLFAVEIHLAAWALLPLWAFALAGGSQRPCFGVLCACLVAGCGQLLFSPTTALTNLQASAMAPLAIGFSAAMVTMFLAGSSLRRRHLSATQLLGLFAAVWIVALVAARVLATGEAAHHIRTASRFYLPVVGVAAVALAPLVGWAVQRRRRAAVVLILALVLPAPRHARRPISFALRELPHVASVLVEYGPPDTLEWTLHAPKRRLYLSYVANHLTESPANQTSAQAVSLVHLAGSPPTDTGDWRVVPLEDSTLLLRDYDPWVHRWPVTICSEPSEGSCFVDRPSTHGHLRPSVRPFTTARTRMSVPSPPLVESARFRFPVTPGPPGETRHLVLLPATPGHGDLAFTSVTGVAYEGTLPSTALILRAEGGPGEVEITRTNALRPFDRDRLPSWLELREDDRWVLDHAGQPPDTVEHWAW